MYGLAVMAEGIGHESWIVSIQVLGHLQPFLGCTAVVCMEAGNLYISQSS